MTDRSFYLVVVFSIAFCANFSWCFRVNPFTSRLISQRQRTHEYFQLKFMSSLTEAPVQAVNNLTISAPTEVQFKIKEARLQDLASIVSLRVNVFYPEVNNSMRSIC